MTDAREARLFGGGVTGQVIVNNRSGLSARADLQASGISAAAAAARLAGVDRLKARRGTG